jgi:phospholipid/cholesterol/gamma-HCH transport system permease protein
MEKNHKFCAYEIKHEPDGEVSVFLHGRLEAATVSTVLKKLSSELKKVKELSVLHIDLTDISYMDDYGAIVLNELKRQLKLPEANFIVKSNSELFRNTIASANQVINPGQFTTSRRFETNLIVQLGEKTLSSFNSLKFFVAFIGSIFFAVSHMMKKPKSLRIGDIIGHMKTTGVDAVPVVALISSLLGLIMAFMSSLQLKQFGANLYVASLVSLAMVSELGPIMTAIVVAGRSGSAYAAEISTMKISEEIDALFTMGFDPVLFLVVPRLIAAVIVIPILTIFADIFAIAGGMLIGITMLNLTPGTYITQTFKTLTLFEFFWGLSKSVVFSVVIAGVGCLRGFQARGGAAAVGHAATSAVVTSIFFIIFFDSLFAVIRSYWG